MDVTRRWVPYLCICMYVGDEQVQDSSRRCPSEGIYIIMAERMPISRAKVHTHMPATEHTQVIMIITVIYYVKCLPACLLASSYMSAHPDKNENKNPPPPNTESVTK